MSDVLMSMANIDFLTLQLGVSGLLTWVKTEAQNVLFVIVIILVIVFAVKRQWIAMVGSLLGLAIISVFVVSPEKIKTLGTTVASWFGL